MNKKLKIASIAVSAVMAGTMAFGMFGCGGGNSSSSGSTMMKPKVDENGKLTYASGTSLNVNIIDSANTDRQISYTSGQIASQWTSFDGNTYQVGNLKPAWSTFASKLGINFVDTAKTGRNGKELADAVNNGEMGEHNFINSSAAQIMQNTSALLDISKYLDYMPNYKAFLEQKPVVQLSLTMSKGGAMYYIPYFDGNDDIEKYALVQRNWVKKVLTDAAGTTTFAAQAAAKELSGTSTSVKSYMGKTAADNWVVETTDPADVDKTIFVKCDYGKVIEALTSGGALKAAVAEAEAISGWDATAAGTLTASGNIVDIMNYVINGSKGKVTGATLAKILREYIKVAYYRGATSAEAASSTTAMYTTNLEDVFTSASAAWDADLMVAMYRCVVTNVNEFDGMASAELKRVYALAGREGKAQRQNDLIALAGELYGVRGLESRLEYTYINSNGELADARVNKESYDAAAKLNDLVGEGLLYTGNAAINKSYNVEKIMTFMLHDYAQTSTTDGFKTQGLTYTKTGGTEQKLDNAGMKALGFDLAPIVTPVSRWDTNDDGTHETVMRFTESWRSVKNTGVCIPKAAIKNSEQLSAILAFIDYLYSNDGQIVGSYGSQASGKTAKDGCWYGNPVTATIGGVTVTNGVGDLAALKTAGVVDTNDGVQYFIANTEANKANKAQYFMFDNKIYTGMAYKDRQIPVMTDLNINFFYGFDVDVAGKMNADNTIGYKKNHQFKYTDYARGVIGAALPIGNKDQGFEYQCTADCALNGASVVSTALNNGTIKHVTLSIDKNNWWYTEAPTVLPTTLAQATTIKDQTYLDGSSTQVGIFNPTSTAGYSNVYIDLAFYGYNTSIKIGTVGKETGSDYSLQANSTALVSYIRGLKNSGLDSRLDYYKQAWKTLKNLVK